VSEPSRSRFHSLLYKVAAAQEVEEELEFHLAMRARELERRGIEPASARLLAKRRFGELKRVRRACLEIARGRDRDMRRREWFAELRQDVVFALRQLRLNPGFTAVAVLTLALGMGATTAIFSAVWAVVLRPLPFPEPDRLAAVSLTWRGLPSGASAGNYLFLRERNGSLKGLAAIQYAGFNLATEDQPERVAGARVTHDFWSVLGVRPLHGRFFVEEEDQPGRERVVVLSHRLWTRRFGADPGAVGRDVRLGGAVHQVIGVMPESFDLTTGEELWVPIAFTPERRVMYDEHFLVPIGRLADGVSLPQAAADLERVVRDLVREHPRENTDRGVLTRELSARIVGPARERLFVMLGAVALVLLIACANLASLTLARGAARAREIAVRVALGAGSGRLLRQLLTESLVVSMLGAAAGLLVAHGALRALIALSPAGTPRLEQAELDGPALLFTGALAVLSSVLVGLLPALRMMRVDVRSGLGSRATIDGGRLRLQRAVVAAEVSLALVLLTGAGLLIRSGINLGRVELGFDPQQLLTARISLPAESYAGHERPARLFEQLRERLLLAPGVLAVGVSSQPSLAGGGRLSNGLIPEGRPLDPRSAIDSRSQFVTPGYFEALRIPIRAGRSFTPGDRRGATKVMIVNETFARVAWPGQPAVGKRVVCCEGGPDRPDWKEVVGVAADVPSLGLGSEVSAEFYLPLDQIPVEAWDWTQRRLTVLARSSYDAAVTTAAMRRALKELDPTIPLFDVLPMEERIGRGLAQARFNTALLTALGALGLLLAAVGLYGVIAYLVSQRTREIGVRMALGATPRTVVLLVARQALALVLAGVAVGGAASLLLARSMETLLFRVSARDPLTLLGGVIVLAIVGTAASIVPSRRASRIDPTHALAES
jgi:predicted permease